MPGAESSGLKLTALATGFVMAALDVTVVNVAGAAIQEHLRASLAALTWIVDGYVLIFASLLMLAGGLANRIGAKTIYLWGMAVFFVASLGCAIAPSVDVLIAARLVQGAAAGFLATVLIGWCFRFRRNGSAPGCWASGRRSWPPPPRWARPWEGSW